MSSQPHIQLAPPRATMARTSPLTFWLCWVTVSSIGAVVGFVSGFILALGSFWILASRFSHVAPSGADWLAGLVCLLLATVLGLTIGAIVGPLQAHLLAWSEDARQRWRVRSMVSWALGAPLGILFSLCLLGAAQQTDVVAAWIDAMRLPVVQVTAIIVGLVVGFGVRPALPPPAPNLAVWLTVYAAATSLGWIIDWLAEGSTTLLGLTLPGIVLGPVVYGIISGSMMLWLERRRLAADDEVI